MILFLIKKAFFDMWDNLLRVFVINIAFLVIATPTLLLVSGAASGIPGWAGWLIIAVDLLALGVFTGAVSEMAKEMVDYHSTGLETFMAGFRASYRQSLIFTAANMVLALLLLVGWRFYTSQGTLLGLGGSVVLIWVFVVWIMIGQLFFPVLSRLDKHPIRVLRKSALLLLDNTFFVLVVTAGTLLIGVASVLLAGLLFGFTTVLIWYHAALKLRLLKYDYLEENPDTDRRRIPWDALLVEERERLGPRSLRGMIFPWKE